MARLSALRTSHLYPTGYIPDSHFFQRMSETGSEFWNENVFSSVVCRQTEAKDSAIFNLPKTPSIHAEAKAYKHEIRYIPFHKISSLIYTYTPTSNQLQIFFIPQTGLNSSLYTAPLWRSINRAFNIKPKISMQKNKLIHIYVLLLEIHYVVKYRREIWNI